MCHAVPVQCDPPDGCQVLELVLSSIEQQPLEMLLSVIWRGFEPLKQLETRLAKSFHDRVGRVAGGGRIPGGVGLLELEC